MLRIRSLATQAKGSRKAERRNDSPKATVSPGKKREPGRREPPVRGVHSPVFVNGRTESRKTTMRNTCYERCWLDPQLQQMRRTVVAGPHMAVLGLGAQCDSKQRQTVEWMVRTNTHSRTQKGRRLPRGEGRRHRKARCVTPNTTTYYFYSTFPLYKH